MGLNQIDEALNRALEHGPVPAAEVKALLLALGYTDKQIRGARERLGVLAERTGYGAALVSVWSLPDQFCPAVAVVPFADDAVLPCAGQFCPDELRQLHAEVERLSLALAAARAEVAALRARYQPLPAQAAPTKPVTLQSLGARYTALLRALPTGWCSVLAVTSQDIDGLRNSPAVHAHLQRLAELELVETKAGGKQTRHGTAVQVYRLSAAGRACLMGT